METLEENGDERSAEAQRDKRINHGAAVGSQAGNAREIPERDGHAEQGETGHEKTSDGARLEGDLEAASQGLRRGLRRAHVGPHRHVHADEAGRARKHRADEEADGDRPAQQQAEADENHHADSADGDVLAAQISLCAFRDRARDLLHARIAGVSLHERGVCHNAVDDRQQAGQND